MTVLQIRLEGPMQAWGTHSKFTERDTGREPSKSGIVGLICSAAGIQRNEDISNLTTLRMGVRVDREGIMKNDFHTALEVPKADPKGRPDTVISNRFYLADACFLVGLEGNSEILQGIENALTNPKWIPFLGRKAFPPSTPLLFDGCQHETTLEESFLLTPWLGRPNDDLPERLRIVTESDGESGDVRMDNPQSFDKRTFSPRSVNTYWVESNLLPRRDSSVSV